MSDWWPALYEVSGGVAAIVLVAVAIVIVQRIYERSRM